MVVLMVLSIFHKEGSGFVKILKYYFFFCHVVKTLRGKDSDWMLSASQLRS